MTLYESLAVMLGKQGLERYLEEKAKQYSAWKEEQLHIPDQKITTPPLKFAVFLMQVFQDTPSLTLTDARYQYPARLKLQGSGTVTRFERGRIYKLQAWHYDFTKMEIVVERAQLMGGDASSLNRMVKRYNPAKLYDLLQESSRSEWFLSIKGGIPVPNTQKLLLNCPSLKTVYAKDQSKNNKRPIVKVQRQ